MSQRPKVVLFDIGGVCVVSPFQAILDYETKHALPIGWVNYAISASSPNGSWQRLERGEIPLDAAFFSAFSSDLSDPKAWTAFHQKHASKPTSSSSAPPPPPTIDAEWLYWEMMRVSRAPEPSIYPALQRLRGHANTTSPGFLIAALSNTSIFPPTHPFSDPTTPEAHFTAALRAHFDLFVSSAHVGLRKPDRAIYDLALRELDALARERGLGAVRPQDVVFLDDIGGNLRTARELGMRTVKVKLGREREAVKELEAVMGLVLAGEVARL